MAGRLPAVQLDRLQRGAHEQLTAALRQAQAAQLTVESRLERGSAAAVLVAASGGATLLVVGSRGRGGFAGLLLGSVSQQCASHARCPVVIVRAGDRPQR
jgi:nucleotide-binding universal stress UspA family protein